MEEIWFWKYEKCWLPELRGGGSRTTLTSDISWLHIFSTPDDAPCYYNFTMTHHEIAFKTIAQSLQLVAKKHLIWSNIILFQIVLQFALTNTFRKFIDSIKTIVAIYIFCYLIEQVNGLVHSIDIMVSDETLLQTNSNSSNTKHFSSEKWKEKQDLC